MEPFPKSLWDNRHSSWIKLLNPCLFYYCDEGICLGNIHIHEDEGVMLMTRTCTMTSRLKMNILTVSWLILVTPDLTASFVLLSVSRCPLSTFCQNFAKQKGPSIKYRIEQILPRVLSLLWRRSNMLWLVVLGLAALAQVIIYLFYFFN